MTLATPRPAEKPRDNSAKTLEALLSKPILSRMRRDGPLPQRKIVVEEHQPITTPRETMRIRWQSTVAQAAFRLRAEARLYEFTERYEKQVGECVHGRIVLDHKKFPGRISRLLRIFSKLFCIDEDALLGPHRFRWLAKPRQVFMWILSQETNHSLARIGRYFNRDHSTVLHAVSVINDNIDLLNIAEKVRDKVVEIEVKLFGSANPKVFQWPEKQFSFEITPEEIRKARKLAAAGYVKEVIAEKVRVPIAAIFTNWGRIAENEL